MNNIISNKNPYHNYDGMKDIDRDISLIYEKLDSDSLILPNYKTGEEDVVCNWYWYGQHFGFNTCPTKEDLEEGYSFPSLIWRGELIPFTYKKRGRLKKNGEPFKRKKGNPKWVNGEWVYETYKGKLEPISRDIQSFWEYLNMNRQVSCGLTHNDRWVIVGDFDVQIEEDTVSKLEDICSKYNIPHFTYLEEHLDTGHYQIGWILNEPFYIGRNSQHSVYKRLTREVGVVFGSDPNFKGWIIKNPNCVFKTRTKWFNDNVDKMELIQSVGITYLENFSNNTPIEEDFVEEELLPSNYEQQEVSVFIDNSTSRNVSLFNELRKWCRDYIKDTGKLPSYEEMFSYGHSFSVSIGNLTNKGTLPISEIRKTITSVLNHFKNRNTDNSYSKEQRFGNIYKGCKKENNILLVYLLKQQGMKNKDIQKELGFNKNTLDKYVRFIKDNEEVFREGDIKSLVPNTNELSEIIVKHKQGKYRSLVDEVYKNIKTIEEGRSV